MNKLKYYIAMLASLFAALFIINALCYFYYRPPQNITNKKGYTSTRLKTGNFLVTGTEGYGVLTIDKNGFNNDGVVKPENAQIVCIGSSQTEAAGVNTSENYVSQLNQICPGFKAYNLGISGQFLANSFYRLPSIKDNYRSCRVIIEETPVLPTVEKWKEIADILENGRLPITNYDWKDANVGMRIVRSMPYIRLLFKNLQDLRKNNTKPVEAGFDVAAYRFQVDRAFHALNERIDKQSLVIVLITFPNLQKNGKMSYIEDIQTETVRKACEKNNVIFIDTAPYFLKEYEKRRVLPNGFANSHIGKGHLNAEGYKILARVLADVLKKEGVS